MEQQSAALRAMNDAVLAIAAEATIEPMLQRLAQSARELVDARYAAIGVPDGEGAFAQFITSGMSDELIAAMGPLPRTHGLLGAMLELAGPLPHAATCAAIRAFAAGGRRRTRRCARSSGCRSSPPAGSWARSI